MVEDYALEVHNVNKSFKIEVENDGAGKFHKTTKNINHLLLVMCAVNTPGLIINAIQYNKLLSGKASGIWIK